MSRTTHSLLALVLVLARVVLGDVVDDGTAPAAFTPGDAVVEALASNPEVSSARAEAQAALQAAGLAAAVERGDWTLTGSTSYIEEQNADPLHWFGHWNLTNELRVLLDDGGKTSAAHAEALAQALVARAKLERTVSDLALRVQVACAETMRAQRVLALYAEGEELVAEHLRMASTLREEGAASELDVLRARSDLASAHADTVGAAAELDQARLELARLLGRDQSAATSLTVAGATADDLPPVADEGDLAALMARIPEVQLAQGEVAVAEAGIDLADAAHRADLELLFGHAYDTDRTDSRHIVQAGVEWSLPLSDHGAKDHRRQQADDLRAAAQFRLENTRDLVEQAIRSARVQVAADQDRLEAAADAARYAATVHRLAGEGYGEGAISMRDLLDARLDYTRAQIERVRAEADLMAVRCRLAQFTSPTYMGSDDTQTTPDEYMGGKRDGAIETPDPHTVDAPGAGADTGDRPGVELRARLGRG